MSKTKTGKNSKKLSRDKEAEKIIQQRHNNAVEEALEDGFDLEDIENAPIPPTHKVKLEDATQFLAYRLRSLNMYKSTTYEDLLDGKLY